MVAGVLDGQRIVIAGGSGFLGLSLAEYLAAQGAMVQTLTRQPVESYVDIASITWDGYQLGSWQSALDGADALINLAGRSVDCVKTPDHQDEILRSRVASTRALGLAMRVIRQPPPVWIQMSTAHIYGDPPVQQCVESSPLGVGLAPTVGRAWEQEFHRAILPEQRGMLLRTSFVVGPSGAAGGGALAKLCQLTKWGLGGTVASGRQGMSWIHQADFNRIVERGITDETVAGVYIVSAPEPVSQREFMRHLRAALGVRIGLPAPAWLVRLGAQWVLRTDPELALYGRYVKPQRLLDEGFEFCFPELPVALRDLV